MINMINIYEGLARHLTGKSVSVSFREPATPNLWGEVARHGERYYIRVSNRLDEDTQFEVLLHEIAHIALHSEGLASSRVPFMEPGAYHAREPTGSAEKAQYYKREEEAEALAEYWLELAREKTVILTPYRMAQALIKNI